MRDDSDHELVKWQGQPGGLTVLIVDPDEAEAWRLGQALGPDAVVQTVPSAQAALAGMRAWIPQLIVTELDLPDDGGLRLIQAVHSDPRTRHVLLIVLTRRAGVRDKIAAFQAGADDFLVKPIEPRFFETRVRLISRLRRSLDP